MTTDAPWPEGMEMIRQIREALGMFAGAMPATPKQAWEEALERARRLSQGQCGGCLERDAQQPWGGQSRGDAVVSAEVVAHGLRAAITLHHERITTLGVNDHRGTLQWGGPWDHELWATVGLPSGPFGGATDGND